MAFLPMIVNSVPVLFCIIANRTPNDVSIDFSPTSPQRTFFIFSDGARVRKPESWQRKKMVLPFITVVGDFVVMCTR